MGASDSKLAFKQGIFKLSELKEIAADDPYWTGFWELPESSEDVFSIFSPADIRRIRDESLRNLETLILAISSRLCALARDPSFPDPERAPERDALNCIRVLTRLLPFIYEADHLEEWQDRFFWGTRRRRARQQKKPSDGQVLFDESAPLETQDTGANEYQDAKPLAEELIDTLIDLLFFPGFTLPRAAAPGKNQVTLTIWQSGVGSAHPIATSQDIEARRMEVLRLLLTMASKSMYTSANILPVQGVKAITYMTTISNKQLVLTLLCSLLNTTLKYNPASWRLPYDHVVFKDPKQMFVTYCLQLLLVLVLYPVPETADGAPAKNYFRHFLGKLHRPQDFQFLVDASYFSEVLDTTKAISNPKQLQATSSYLPGSQKSLTWAPEMVMLFWEVLQCNKRFRSFIVETDRAHDFLILIIFHAMQNRSDPSKQGNVRMCIFVLQTLSVEPTFGERLNKPFRGHDDLPQGIRIPNFLGTYADFLIMSIYTLITSSKGKVDAVYPALLAIINNIAPHVQDLSPSTSAKLIQLFVSMSSPTFLLANETNHDLLHSLLEAINAIIEHQYKQNSAFVMAILRARKRFHALRDFAIDGGQEELHRQAQLRKEAGEDPDFRNQALHSPSSESLRSPSGARAPSLSNVPEEGDAFAIGDDDDSGNEDENKPTPTTSNRQSHDNSRTPSIAESADGSLQSLPVQLRGMSEKARGKLPASQASFSRQSSNASLNSLTMSSLTQNGNFEPNMSWIDTWLPELPLHTILTVIDQLGPEIQLPGISSSTPAPSSSSTTAWIREAEIHGLEPSPVRVHLFEWSPLSLGWYESLLWSLIFSTEMAMFKGGPGVWKGTNIKLFRVQETAAQGPTLLQPQGAVDAVGSNLVKKIGSLQLRSSAKSPQHNSSGGVIRDV